MKQVIELGSGFAFFRKGTALEGLVYGPAMEGELMHKGTLITDNNFEEIMSTEGGTINLNTNTFTTEDISHSTNNANFLMEQYHEEQRKKAILVSINEKLDSVQLCSNEGCSNERPKVAWVDSEGNTASTSYEGTICYTCAAYQTNNNEKVELTMEKKTINQQAEAILENIKSGTTTMVDTVKGFDAMGTINKAWSTIKDYDYKGSIQKGFDMAGKLYDKVSIWFTTTKLGRASGYVLGATTTMAAVGFFLSPIPTVLVGAALYTGIKAFTGKREDLTAFNVAKAFVINALLFATIATVAYIVLPYVFVAMSYLYYAGVYALLLPGAAILV